MNTECPLEDNEGNVIGKIVNIRETKDGLFGDAVLVAGEVIAKDQLLFRKTKPTLRETINSVDEVMKNFVGDEK